MNVSQNIKISEIVIGNRQPMVLIGGMNVLESESIAMRTAEHYAKVTQKIRMPWIFKASFDKANRSSVHSYRGPGLEEGLRLLEKIKCTFSVPLLTDVHEVSQCNSVAQVVDIIQIPAFLVRQTDLVAAIAKTDRIVNIKKPQFLSPYQMGHVVEKFATYGAHQMMLCERGSNFGYDNLVVDMLGFQIMKQQAHDVPIIFDVTHALQCRSVCEAISGGRREQTADLARAGTAVGIAGLFLEAHPHPEHALCDGPCALPLEQLEPLLKNVQAIDNLVKNMIL